MARNNMTNTESSSD